jgi:hypothetical protein
MSDSRARAIDRTLSDILEDISEIRKAALARVWKGHEHPDYGSALKACELEAKLRGFLRERADDANSLADQVWPRMAAANRSA